jgi:hypothetical protein
MLISGGITNTESSQNIKIYLDCPQLNKIILFPINPDEIKILKNSPSEKINSFNLGDISKIQKPELWTLDFISFLPIDNSLSFITDKSKFNTPSEILNFINSVQINKYMCYLSVLPRINMQAVTIEKFEITQKEANGDIYFDIGFQEFRYYSAKIIDKNNKTVDINKRPDPKALPKEVVITGNGVTKNAWTTAKRYLNNGALISSVLKVNNLVNPNQIINNMRIKMPYGVQLPNLPTSGFDATKYLPTDLQGTI